jgi:hypothetical protein
LSNPAFYAFLFYHQVALVSKIYIRHHENSCLEDFSDDK